MSRLFWAFNDAFEPFWILVDISMQHPTEKIFQGEKLVRQFVLIFEFLWLCSYSRLILPKYAFFSYLTFLWQ